MCGIFGCASQKNIVPDTLEGLRRLEYRGYDSSGIAGISQGKIVICKEVGKVSEMESKVSQEGLHFQTGIAQTRWATHGRPTKENAHPHIDSESSLAIIHNGIIENHSALRKWLEEKGALFRSDTDTEVIAHLVADLYKGDILNAFQQALALLHGSYAIALIHKDFPDRILVAANGSPLAIGIANQCHFISSDANAFNETVGQAIYLGDGEIGVVKSEGYELFDSSMMPITKEVKVLLKGSETVSKGDFDHYTLKEIFEQPNSLRAALASRCLMDYGTAQFDDLTLPSSELLSFERIIIVACGTSLHAGLAAAYFFEDFARIPTQVEISSELRYKNPVIPHRTLCIAISQSGETADTLAAVRELKAKGCRVVGICNVYESSLTRESDSTINLRAGPEIGVCSTKAFTNQVAILLLFGLMLARMRHVDKQTGQKLIQEILKLPDRVQTILNSAANIERAAIKYAHFDNFFYLGRKYMYPSALEGALKIKEIAYVNANGYPAGEMKHGPIALIAKNCPTVALCANKTTYEKILSNLMEVKARSGPVLAVAEEGCKEIGKIADDVLWVPETIDALAVIPTSVVLQLFAYYLAKERGAEIDQPRNLAKSVTVE